MAEYRVWYHGYAEVEANSAAEAAAMYLKDVSCALYDDFEITDAAKVEEEDNNA